MEIEISRYRRERKKKNMASPQQKSKPPKGGTLNDSKHAPGLLDPQMTWAQILQNKHMSLMHNVILESPTENHTLNNNEWTVIPSHI